MMLNKTIYAILFLSILPASKLRKLLSSIGLREIPLEMFLFCLIMNDMLKEVFNSG